jgi:hypothetical protein
MNPLFNQTREKVEQSVPQKFKQEFDRIVTAGRKAMWSEGPYEKETLPYLQSIQGPQDVTPKVSHGVVKLISVVLKEVKIPPKADHPFYAASFPASHVLMVDALENLEQTRQMQVTPDTIAETTQAVNAGLFRLYGIKPDQVKQGLTQAHQMAQGGMMDRESPQAGPPAAPTTPPQGV